MPNSYSSKSCRQPATATTNTMTNSQVVKYNASDAESSDNEDHWTTSKRKVNHTTRQVETRVSRQLLVEDGKIIADSGPQVTTRIKEDNKVEECEKEKTPRNKQAFRESLDNVLGEKKEIQRVSREVREENMQYHDERFKELTGRDVHQRAIRAPHELMTVQADHDRYAKEDAPRGKMVHYSNKGKRYQDTDEILTVSKLAIDGSITKEEKRTRHHEEFSDDEKPDEKGEAEALARKPIVERSSRRFVDTVNDFDDTDTPDEYSDREHGHVSRSKSGGGGNKLMSSASASSSRRRNRSREDEAAFPRYEIDPLLNSLRAEDYSSSSRPAAVTSSASSGRHSRERRIEHSPAQLRYTSASSSSDDDDNDDDDDYQRRAATSSSSHGHRSHGATTRTQVEIPEEYRINKQRMMSSRNSNHSGRRSQSPAASSHRSGRSGGHGHGRRAEDVSVQARLTDEVSYRHRN